MRSVALSVLSCLAFASAARADVTIALDLPTSGPCDVAVDVGEVYLLDARGALVAALGEVALDVHDCEVRLALVLDDALLDQYLAEPLYVQVDSDADVLAGPAPLDTLVPEVHARVLADTEARVAAWLERHAPSRGVIVSANMHHSKNDYALNITSNFSGNGCMVIPLGFVFRGFGAETTHVGLTENGILHFAGGCYNDPNNTALPTSAVKYPTFFFFWDELHDYGSGEFVRVRQTGQPGGRVLHIHFRTRIKDACDDDKLDITLAIHEGIGLVQASYKPLGGCERLRGSGATIGLQTAGGANAKAYVVSVNSPVLDDDAPVQSVSFQDPGE